MRKAKRRCQQLVAAAMCVGMLAGMVPTQVFAEEAQPAAAFAQQEQAPAPSANETETPAPTEEPAAKQTPAPAEEPAAEQTPAPAEEPAAEETAAQAAEVMSAAVQDSEKENFGKVLEDQDLVAVRCRRGTPSSRAAASLCMRMSNSMLRMTTPRRCLSAAMPVQTSALCPARRTAQLC